MYGFKMSSFYEKCGNLNNILILAKTTKRKIVGGFTPLTFNPPGNEWTGLNDEEAIKDESYSSFVFS